MVAAFSLLVLSAPVEIASAQVPVPVETPYTLMDDESRLHFEGGAEAPLRGNGPLTGYVYAFVTRPHFLDKDLYLRMVVAPVHSAQKSTMAWDLVNVEALPHSVLMNGVSWDWETFPEYMNAIERNGIALNVSFLVPLSALRFYVLGEEAAERAATEEETRRMAQVFREAMMAGAIALAIYSVVVCHLLVRTRLRAAPATLLSLVVWLICAVTVWPCDDVVSAIV